MDLVVPALTFQTDQGDLDLARNARYAEKQAAYRSTILLSLAPLAWEIS
jgi:hypothetical protein